MVLENSFDRGDELDADKEGIVLAQKAGYAGTGLSRIPHDAGGSQQERRKRRTACSHRIPKLRSGLRK